MSNNAEEIFKQNIDTYGWAITKVRNEEHEDGPTFSYSTGLWKNYSHPEFIIFGLPDEIEIAVINACGSDVESNGQKFEANQFYNDVLEGHNVFMLLVDEEHRKRFATWTDWYYERNDFPLLQIVWPGARTGEWPWDTNDLDLKVAQPLLGLMPTNNSY